MTTSTRLSRPTCTASWWTLSGTRSGWARPTPTKAIPTPARSQTSRRECAAPDPPQTHSTHLHLARSRTAFLAPPRRCVRASHVPPLHRYDYHITTTHPHFGMHAGQAYWFGDGLIHSHPGTSWQWFHHTEGLGATLGAFLEQTGVRAAPPLMPPPPPSQPRCVTRRVPSSPYTSSPSAPPRSHSAAPMLSHSSGGQVALYDGADSR